ncbi:hypothetical protein L9F63_001642, partial [Diploptera punctata]
MDISNSVKITIITSHICCILPFNTAQNLKHRINICNILQAVHCFVIFILLLTQFIRSFISWFQPEISLTLFFSGFSNALTCMFTYVTGVIISALYFEKLLNSFNNSLHPFQNYKSEFNKILKLQTIIPLIVGFILISVDFLSYVLSYDVSVIDVCTSCTYFMFIITIHLVDIQFVTFVVILKQCFRIINNKLLFLIKRSREILIVTNPTQGLSYQTLESPEIRLDTESISKKNTTVEIKILPNLHCGLRMLTKYVNAVYSAHALLHMLLIYCQLSFRLYHIFEIVLFYE